MGALFSKALSLFLSSKLLQILQHMKVPKALILVVVGALISKVKSRFFGPKLPPGSFGLLPLFGRTFEYVKDPKAFILKNHKQYEGTFKTNVLFSPTVFLYPTAANAKLIYQQGGMGWAPHWTKILGRYSLPMVNGQMHTRVRKMSQRAFSPTQLDNYLPRIQELTKEHLQRWADKAVSMDMYKPIKWYTFDVAQTILLGIRIPEERTKRFMERFENLIRGMDCLFPFDLPGFPWRGVMLCREELKDDYQNLIDERQAQLRAGEQPTSMLDAMLEAEDPIPSKEELQDFCIGNMFAGHETTLSSIQSMMYWLKKADGVEAELRTEVREVWDGKSPITRETIGALNKTRAFVQEVWRITPVVHLAMRTLHNEVVADGYTIPKGWKIAMAATVAGMKCENPDEFRINRHLKVDGSFENKMGDYESSVFAIFGCGPRMCMGSKMATDEILVFLLNLLRHFDYDKESEEMVKFVFNFWRVKATFRRLPNDD